MRNAIVCILGALFAAFFYADAAGCGEITIVYTANCSGKLKACGCPGESLRRLLGTGNDDT